MLRTAWPTSKAEWVSERCSVVSDSLWPHGLYSPWNSPGQNTELGSHSFLQGICSTQGSNPGLPHCRQILYQLSHQGSPGILEWTCCFLTLSTCNYLYQPKFPLCSFIQHFQNSAKHLLLGGNCAWWWGYKDEQMIHFEKLQAVQFIRSVVSNSLQPHEKA